MKIGQIVVVLHFLQGGQSDQKILETTGTEVEVAQAVHVHQDAAGPFSFSFFKV